jgi:hypothetical protein
MHFSTTRRSLVPRKLWSVFMFIACEKAQYVRCRKPRNRIVRHRDQQAFDRILFSGFGDIIALRHWTEWRAAHQIVANEFSFLDHHEFQSTDLASGNDDLDPRTHYDIDPLLELAAAQKQMGRWSTAIASLVSDQKITHQAEMSLFLCRDDEGIYKVVLFQDGLPDDPNNPGEHYRKSPYGEERIRAPQKG